MLVLVIVFSENTVAQETNKEKLLVKELKETESKTEKIKILNELIKISADYNYESKIHFNKQLLKIYQDLKKTDDETQVLFDISILSVKADKSFEALQHFEEIMYNEKIKQDLKKVFVMIMAGEAEKLKTAGKLKQAIFLSNETIKFSSRIKDYSAMKKSYGVLYDCYKYIGNIKASNLYYNIYREFDEILNKKSGTKTNSSKIPIIIMIVIVVFFGIVMVYFTFQQKVEMNKKLELKNEKIKKQNVEIAGQRNRLQKALSRISTQKQALEKTLQDLKETQSQLIQSEKMASLGQLIAGIAHELNTPLGAIKSSIGTVKDTAKKSLRLLPEIISYLSSEHLALFNDMIESGINNTSHFTSREERKIKRSVKKDLESLGVEEYDEIAEYLIDIGVHQNIEKFVPLFNDKKSNLIMDTAYQLVSQYKNGDNIKIAVDRAAKIIFALKSYSHQDASGEKIKAKISNGIETVLTIYHNQLKHGIIVDKKFNNVPELMCYPDELNQVWTNIIHNAVQAMDGKGKLTIEIKTENKNLIVSFQDTGGGIPDEIKDKIFTPFFTTKAAGEGTGLGLDIIRKIIEKHKGKITFDSITGKGTTFFVYLPLNE